MRRILNAEVKLLSLVPRGANKLPVLYKSDGCVEFQPISKWNDEKGELLSVVYAPELRDSQGDIASADVIRKMAHSFARNGANLDIKHDGVLLSKKQCYVAESFIIQKGDERFKDWKDYDGNPVDVTGGWATLLKVEDESLRKAYRDGGWNGVSLFADKAELAVGKSADDVSGMLSELVKALRARNENNQEIDMKLEDLKKLLDERDEKLLKSIDEKIAKGAQPPAPEAPTKPPEQPGKSEAELKLEKQVSEMQARLDKLAKASTQPTQDEPPPEKKTNSMLTKEEAAGVVAGKRLAKIMNSMTRAGAA